MWQEIKSFPYFKDRRMDEIKPKDVMEWQNELLNYRDEKESLIHQVT